MRLALGLLSLVLIPFALAPAVHAGPGAPPPGSNSGTEDTVHAPAAPRIFVHYCRSAAGGRKLAAEAALYVQNRGYEIADIREVAYDVSQPRVRYFFAEDRPSAERIARLFDAYLRSLTSERSPARVQDYTHFRPLPARGNIEVWLPTSLAPW